MNVLLFFLASISFSFSKSFGPHELALLAVERAPLIKMSVENTQVAKHQVSQNRLYSNPTLSVMGGSVKSGTQSGNALEFTLSQPIPWPGKRQAGINSAKILEKISAVDLEEAKLLVQHSASLLAIELAVLNELEKHHHDRKKRFSIIHRYLTSRPLPSPKQQLEKDLIETQINLVEAQMFDLETMKRNISEQLMFLTGQNQIEVRVPWDVQAPFPKNEYLSQLENNPRYQRSLKQVELAQGQVEEAQYLAKPDIVIGANYREERVVPVNRFLHAQVAVVIPIFDRNQHSVEMARAQVRMKEAGKMLTMNESVMELNQNYQKLISSYRSMEIFKIGKINKQEQRFHLAEDAFKKGRIDVLTFLETDTQIHEAVDAAYHSYLKYFTALSEINLLIGQKLEVK